MENGIRVENKHCKSPHPANGEGNVQKGLCSHSKYKCKYNRNMYLDFTSTDIAQNQVLMYYEIY